MPTPDHAPTTARGSTARPPRDLTPARGLWGPDAGVAAALVALAVVVWVSFKLLSVWAWVLVPEQYGDTYYYFLTAQKAHAAGGVAAALREYPTPAGLLLLAPYELGATHWTSYRAAVLAMTSAVDALFAVVLGRRLGPSAVLAWVLFTSALGQLALLRFDVLPAVAGGLVVLWAARNRRVAAGVAVAVGTALKAVPILLLPLLLRRRDRAGNLHGLAATAVAGLALVVVSVVTGGWTRLLSPLGYQRDRGLQIESVAATYPMLRWGTDPRYAVWYSPFNAYEVTGPSVGTWLNVAQALSVVGGLACVALLAWWWLRGTDAHALPWLAIVLVGTFVVTSRALSPQYLLWLAAPTAVLVGRAVVERRLLGPALVTAAGLLVLCVLTTAVYPVYYGGLVSHGDSTRTALSLLVARNLGLLAFLAWCAACVVGVGREGVRTRR